MKHLVGGMGVKIIKAECEVESVQESLQRISRWVGENFRVPVSEMKEMGATAV